MRTSYYYYYIPTKKFTSREIAHLLISLLVLTIAFSFAFSDFFITRNISALAYIFPIALVAVATGFLLHELMHKIVAQKYGCWAEYRAFPFGLLLALLMSIAGFVFAAPGAVYIMGSVTKKENGKISLAGPLVNMAIAATCLPFVFVIPAGYIRSLTFMVYWANSFLAFFNMLPIPPFDGSKVFRWSLGIYIVSFVAVLVLAIPGFLVLSGRLSIPPF
ncbi:MAG: site-2 protease family protein [Candidatus Thermoplasmatota archaeon]